MAYMTMLVQIIELKVLLHTIILNCFQSAQAQ